MGMNDINCINKWHFEHLIYFWSPLYYFEKEGKTSIHWNSVWSKISHWHSKEFQSQVWFQSILSHKMVCIFYNLQLKKESKLVCIACLKRIQTLYDHATANERSAIWCNIMPYINNIRKVHWEKTCVSIAALGPAPPRWTTKSAQQSHVGPTNRVNRSARPRRRALNRNWRTSLNS